MAIGLVFGAEFLALVVYSNWMINRSRKRNAAALEFPYLIVDNTAGPEAA